MSDTGDCRTPMGNSEHNTDDDQTSSRHKLDHSASADQTRVSGVEKGTSLYLFVKMLTGRSLGFNVNKSDAVITLVEKINNITSIPVTELRLVYGGRQLDLDKSFSEFGIEREATLHLVGRLCSVRNILAWRGNSAVWRAVDEMVTATIYLGQGGEYDSLLHISVSSGMKKFLDGFRRDIFDVGLCIRDLRVFCSLCATDSLSVLYLSSGEGNSRTGREAIEAFLRVATEVPENLRYYIAPLVLQFCQHLGKPMLGKEYKTLIYYECRRTLATLVGAMPSTHPSDAEFKRCATLQEIFPFMIEVGNQLLEDLKYSALTSWSTVPMRKDVKEFCLFLDAVLLCFETSLCEGGCLKTLSLPLQEAEILGHPFYKEFKFISTFFIHLLSNMSSCLLRLEKLLLWKVEGRRILSHVGSQYLSILKALHALSKIYNGATKELSAILMMRKVAIHALVMRCAEHFEYEDWLFELKYVLDYKCRIRLAVQMLPDEDEDYAEAQDMLIDRSNLFAESFAYIISAKPEELRADLFIAFKNELATGPGVFREWLSLVCKEIFTSNNIFLLSNPSDLRRVYINPASKLNPLHCKYFRFCGRVIALVLLNQVHVGVFFDPVFIIQLAGLHVRLEDIKDTDPTFYRSCKQILEMDAELVDSDALGLTFVTERLDLGSRETIELVPGKEFIKVNSRNRADYVDAIIRNRFDKAIHSQACAFAQGFEDIFPREKCLQSFLRWLDLKDVDTLLVEAKVIYGSMIGRQIRGTMGTSSLTSRSSGSGRLLKICQQSNGGSFYSSGYR